MLCSFPIKEEMQRQVYGVTERYVHLWTRRAQYFVNDPILSCLKHVRFVKSDLQQSGKGLVNTASKNSSVFLELSLCPHLF